MKRLSAVLVAVQLVLAVQLVSADSLDSERLGNAAVTSGAVVATAIIVDGVTTPVASVDSDSADQLAIASASASQTSADAAASASSSAEGWLSVPSLGSSPNPQSTTAGLGMASAVTYSGVDLPAATYTGFATAADTFRVLAHPSDPSVTRGLLTGNLSIQSIDTANDFLTGGQVVSAVIGPVVLSGSALGGGQLTIDVFVDGSLEYSTFGTELTIITEQSVSVGANVALGTSCSYTATVDPTVNGSSGSTLQSNHASFTIEALDSSDTSSFGLRGIWIGEEGEDGSFVKLSQIWAPPPPLE